MGRILIIEDNDDISVLYQRALFHHEHVVVQSAEAAMKLVATQSYDLIILDLHLPEQSGLVVLDHLRRELDDQRTPVFAISADDLLRRQCEAFGIQAWMTKPIELDELMIIATELIETHITSKH